MERVLTDGEVEACWQAWKGDHHVALIRKVEEMVLLKYPLPYSGGGVTEAETRERERKAYVAGWQENEWPRKKTFPAARLEQRYPLLSHPQQTPRTVTLSDGTTIKKSLGCGYERNGTHIYGGTEIPWRWAKTPEDAEALADLVRHPFEGR